MSSGEIAEIERKPKKTGRKGFEITPQVLDQIELHAGLGFNMEQIACDRDWETDRKSGV